MNLAPFPSGAYVLELMDQNGHLHRKVLFIAR